MFSYFRCLKRVGQLEEEMLKLARIVESRDLDWQDMRARVKRLLDRTEKSARRLDAAPEELAPEQTEEAADGHVLPLSPSQQRLQMQIMRQRQTRKVS